MRFAIWSAVSTAAQATDDKVSLQQQETKSRLAATAKGWQETAGPYIVAGASRSFFVNLSDAEKDIPQLRQMLEDARADLFDVLVIYTYDRLGDLVEMIAQSLRFYGKQIYSVSQPSEPQPPESFDPYASEGESTMRDVARITQRFRINDLRRKWKAGMPARIRRGLTPLRVPFGYNWVSKKDPPRLDPQKARLLVEMKDLLLKGQTVTAIARHATASGIPTANGLQKWDTTAVRYILSNPYYAGTTTLHKLAYVRDPRRNNKHKAIPQPRNKWVTGEGKHQPVWDIDTHRAIIGELERRRERHKNYASRFPLSGLLSCSICRRKVHRRSHGHGTDRRKVLSCEYGRPSHILLPYEQTVELVAREIAVQLSKHRADPLTANSQQPTANSQQLNSSALADLHQRRKRVQEGFEAGLYTPDEAARKLADLETAIQRLADEIEEGERSARARAEFMNQLGTDNLEHFPAWVQQDDPAIVNRLLSALCRDIILHPDRTVEIIWRG